jgi:hypothetical protein
MASNDEIAIIRGQRFAVTQCGSCGVVYTVPEVMHDTMRSEGGYACCPNGHKWGWAEGSKKRDELRAERDRLKQQIAQKDDEIRAERHAREEAERLASAAKGQITKLKKRAKGGVCPCCNRQFADMARHMETKHPEFDPKVVDLGVEKAKRA